MSGLSYLYSLKIAVEIFLFNKQVISSIFLFLQNNPNEARNMLLQNPQLAYALLQAQVVMRIVDPNVAVVSKTIMTLLFGFNKI